MTFTLNNLRYSYPGRSDPVLRGVSTAIPAGTTTAVIGRSGAGKTTILHLLGLLREHLHPPGTVVFRHPDRPEPLDYHRLSRDPTERARLRLSAFGLVIQTSYLLPHFTCLQNLALPLALQGVGRAERDRRAIDLLERAGDRQLLDLCVHKRTKGSHVSVGQRQRVAALRALVHDPCVLFADEPTSSLDQGNADAIYSLFKQWRAGHLAGNGIADDRRRAVLLVCHQLETALDRSSRVIVLDDGAVFRDFPTAEWATHAADVNRLLGRNLPADYVSTSPRTDLI